MTNDSLTRRQEFLVRRIRDIDSQLNNLRLTRSRLFSELEQLIPRVPKVAPPKEPGTVLSIFNYKQLGDQCRIFITRPGIKTLEKFEGPQIDLAILSIALDQASTGVDATWLLNFEGIRALDSHPDHKVHRLYKQGLVDLRFEKVE